MKKNKLVMIMVIILVVITLIGVIAFVLLTKFNKEAEPEEPTIEEIVLSSVDVEELTTNLADNKFVRISFKIQTDGEEAAAELLQRDFQIKNLIIQELSEMNSEDLSGKAGKMMLTKTLKTQLNELMQNGEVVQVYIKTFIIQ